MSAPSLDCMGPRFGASALWWSKIVGKRASAYLLLGEAGPTDGKLGLGSLTAGPCRFRAGEAY